MRLTNYTDYALRVLIYLATKQNDQLASIKEIADVYGISKNHLMKVTYQLSKIGAVKTVRGRNGGICLAKDPSEINIGKIVRLTEEDFKLVECMDGNDPVCIISPVCGLKHVLNQALAAYLNVLDQYSLADIVRNPLQYAQLFQIKEAVKDTKDT
ncbi:RrF2 family transcriptional regulator [Heyndrickxia ginsengihumi]|uniref:HTH-type transcriptional regulator NsrR n=1 Tax=Heyndrickxia ginsengihumi TaxID=363870 RepID=A0A0A6VG68_9BACI|nr:Rrf2 family transcriptional regulator [Heyndrickxia ginsengihumi]KHD85619.1 Rrf2 family transcriptional regulator [Heyndrickxia ginsengihumi]MBE6182853.1 Rrf2 family transcriptional regulator [Bacillus sp. (in: firmicutes)]MCM3024839.1 Rrf2 family transcriptional regulator [Heyndrickxia ginsengihumi]NEY21397.1 Rrf2 family transcriptional regulator [Heyndrickxia ginsengihumi]